MVKSGCSGLWSGWVDSSEEIYIDRSSTNILNKNSPGLLKKAQSRIKSIAWHLRWLARTRADIGLRPSGLVDQELISSCGQVYS